MFETNYTDSPTPESNRTHGQEIVSKYRSLLYLGATGAALVVRSIEAKNHESFGSLAFDTAATVYFAAAAVLTFRHDNPTINPED